MEFSRIFYRNGGHDEVPSDRFLDDPDGLAFLAADDDVIRVSLEDVLAIEDR